ncbi:MAG: hypothetical protein K0R51_1181 [Cytophagaceae bacterium]|jgi:uncharacterized membrane protein YkgB|nr:hypothetical protein [Cytophagaceae bacterium]
MKKFIILLANSQRYFIHALRIVIFTVFILFAVVEIVSNQGDYPSYAGAGVVVIIGTMVLLGIWFYKIGLVGGLLIAVASLAALIFLLVAIANKLHEPHQFFQFFSGLGPLFILMAGGLICASDCAKQIFREYVLRMGKG